MSKRFQTVKEVKVQQENFYEARTTSQEGSAKKRSVLTKKDNRRKSNRSNADYSLA
jgi:hypothetical protein